MTDNNYLSSSSLSSNESYFASHIDVIKSDIMNYCVSNPTFCKLIWQLNMGYKEFSGDDVIRLAGTRSCPSLRIIEFFVTRFRHRQDIYITHVQTLSTEYQNQLLTFKKQLFDPFRRDHGLPPVSIRFDANAGSLSRSSSSAINGSVLTVDTTYCQLNFFRWAVSVGLFKIMERYQVEFREYIQECEEARQAECSGSNGSTTSSVGRRLGNMCF